MRHVEGLDFVGGSIGVQILLPVLRRAQTGCVKDFARVVTDYIKRGSAPVCAYRNHFLVNFYFFLVFALGNATMVQIFFPFWCREPTLVCHKPNFGCRSLFWCSIHQIMVSALHFGIRSFLNLNLSGHRQGLFRYQPSVASHHGFCRNHSIAFSTSQKKKRAMDDHHLYY